MRLRDLTLGTNAVTGATADMEIIIAITFAAYLALILD